MIYIACWALPVRDFYDSISITVGVSLSRFSWQDKLRGGLTSKAKLYIYIFIYLETLTKVDMSEQNADKLYTDTRTKANKSEQKQTKADKVLPSSIQRKGVQRSDKGERCTQGLSRPVFPPRENPYNKLFFGKE